MKGKGDWRKQNDKEEKRRREREGRGMAEIERHWGRKGKKGRRRAQNMTSTIEPNGVNRT